MLINSKIAVQNEGSVCSDRKGSVCAEYPVKVKWINKVLEIQFLENNIGDIWIYKLSGEEMIYKEGGQLTERIDLTHLDSGLYWLNVQSADKKSISKKIVIE